MATSFKFNNLTKTIPYSRGYVTLPFTSEFTSNVYFSYSDSSIINNATINKTQTEVKFEVLTEGGSAVRTLGLTARTIPDYNVETIYEQTNATQVIVNPNQVQYIKYAEADGSAITINNLGAVTWTSSKQYHKVTIKFVDGYNGDYLFQNIQGIVSARVSIYEVGDSMFESSSIQECMFCDTVRNIGSDIFLFATGFTSVWLPQTLQSIGNRVFARTNLDLINCYFQEVIEWGELCFDGVGDDVTLYFLDDGSGWEQDWYDEIMDGGAQTCQTIRLDFPEEGNEYDCYLSEYYGVVEDMTFYSNYEQNQIGQLTTNITIYQQITKIALEKNICDNITVTLPSNSQEYISYRINSNNETIFEGRVLSSGDNTTIRLNNAIEQHIPTDFIIPNKNKIERYYNYGLFTLEYSYDDFATSIQYSGVIKVYNDWTYVSDLKTSLTNQLEKEVVSYQPIIECFELHKGESGSTSIVYERDNGTTRQVTSQTFEQCSVIVHANAPKTDGGYNVTGIIVRLTRGNNVIEHRYKVKQCDSQIRMYVRNKMGGFDTINFNRTSKETDSFTINSYIQDSIVNNSLETTQYRKDIAKTWELKSNWISDAKSPLVQDLFASTQAYLHLQQHFTLTKNTDDIVAVNITSTKAERKTFFSNGRKFNQYIFNVEEKNKVKFM